MSLLSIERRIDIFAACQHQTIHFLKNLPGGSGAGERWDYQWYEPCTFQGNDVGAVQPDAVGSAGFRVGSGRDGDDARLSRAGTSR